MFPSTVPVRVDLFGLDELSLVSDITEYKDNTNVVTLMTVHSSKGLEFNNVFVIGLEEGIFPHSNSFDSTNDIEEERRLFYVAITRARNNLFLVNSKRRLIYGNDMINPVSRFIKEIDEDLLKIENNVDEIKTFTKENMINKDEEYKVGEKIKHDTFGIGVLVSVDKSILSIAFPHPIGIKTLMKGHKSIKKL